MATGQFFTGLGVQGGIPSGPTWRRRGEWQAVCLKTSWGHQHRPRTDTDTSPVARGACLHLSGRGPGHAAAQNGRALGLQLFSHRQAIGPGSRY
jgi:hypothetical protein